MESDFSANGEIVLTILEEAEIVYPESVSFMGSFAASNWENDIDLVTADEGATWTGSQDFVVGDTWKLRMNYGWATSWGFDNLRNYPAEALDNEPNADGNGFSGNIRVLQAGTFTVSFDYLASKIDVTFVPGEVEEPEPEPVIETLTITAADLGLGAYADGDKTVGEYGIHFNQAGDYGNGIQFAHVKHPFKIISRKRYFICLYSGFGEILPGRYDIKAVRQAIDLRILCGTDGKTQHQRQHNHT